MSANSLFNLSKHTAFKVSAAALMLAGLACNTLIPPATDVPVPTDVSLPTPTSEPAVKPTRPPIAALETQAPVSTDVVLEPEATEAPLGDTLFNDSFDDNSNDWGEYSDSDGSVSVNGGVLSIQVLTEQFFYWTSPSESYSDVDMTFEAQPVEGDEANISYGGMCRYEDNDNFYIFTVSADGYYNLGKYVDDEYEAVVDWETSSVINTGNSLNTIRVICVGPVLQMYVNDELLISTRDEDLTGSGFALHTGTFDVGTDPVTVTFDNLVVSAPDPDLQNE
jgi:hypothetical protein